MTDYPWYADGRAWAPRTGDHHEDFGAMSETGSLAELVKTIVEADLTGTASISYGGGELAGEDIRTAYFDESFPLSREREWLLVEDEAGHKKLFWERPGNPHNAAREGAEWTEPDPDLPVNRPLRWEIVQSTPLFAKSGRTYTSETVRLRR